jgi:uncharacterized protein YifE (UPF0438 family)
MFCFTRCQAYLILRAINSTAIRELGDFTIKEAQLLERFGYAFNELDSGKRQPATEEEQLFVAVCRGEREAATEQEKVWAKYLARTRRPKKFHTLSGGKPQADAVEDYSDSED